MRQYLEKLKNYGDICTAERLDYADLWTYSFPCQDISAGKQQGINQNTKVRAFISSTS